MEYDVLIIGAGVSGSAIARELSKTNLKTIVLEKEEDVCEGTSKANSGIVHAGYDAKPGTLKAKLNVRGSQMIPELAKTLHFEYENNGSLVLCFEEAGRATIEELYERGQKNGVPGLRILEKEEILAMEPSINDSIVCALYAPTVVSGIHHMYSIIDLGQIQQFGVTYWLPLASAANIAQGAAALAVGLQDLEGDLLAQQGGQVPVTGDTGLGGGDEHPNALDGNHHAALVVLGDKALDHGLVLPGGLDLLPALVDVQAALGQLDHAVPVADLHDDGLDLIAHLHKVLHLYGGVVAQLGEGNVARVLDAQLHLDFGGRDGHNGAGNLISIIQNFERLLQHLLERFVHL